jgi:hypothetical protein
MASIIPRTFRNVTALPKRANWSMGMKPLAQPMARRFMATSQEQPRLRLGSTGMLNVSEMNKLLILK